MRCDDRIEAAYSGDDIGLRRTAKHRALLSDGLSPSHSENADKETGEDCLEA